MQQKQDKYTISFFDLFFIFKKKKRQIFLGAFLCSILGLLYASTKPIEYEAIASFREQGKSQPGISQNTLSSVLTLGVSNTNASEALSLMKSRKLLEMLVKHLGMQASVDKREIRFDTLSRLRDNLKIEYAYLTKKRSPVLPDLQPAFCVRDVDYSGLIPIGIKIRFHNDAGFQVIERDGTEIMGQWGVPVQTKYATFTLLNNSSEPLTAQEYSIVFDSLYNAVQHISDKLILDTDRDDRLLIKLKYACGMRCQAVECLDSLMTLYQSHLRNDQQRVLREQIDYLYERQDHMQAKLQQMMEVHATTLASDAVSTGFLNSEKAMEFLAANLQHYTQQLIAIDLELKQLARVQREGSEYYDRLAAKDENAPINQVLSKIRSLKQQSDSLDLVLREATTDYKTSAINFVQQNTDLEKVQKFSEEAQTLLSSLENNEKPNTNLKIYDEPKYMVKAWCEKLAASKTQQEKKHCTANFMSYLTNLLHLFQVHTKAIQERLTHQQSPHLEFQGLDLPTAQSLYVDYNKQINAVETSLLQHKFLIEKMKDPDFEMSALSAILTDPVSRDMIDSGAKAMLALKDEKNRSVKEQERLKQELDLQKKFLTAHIDQTIELQQIQKQLLTDKIRALQSATLGLTQQEISVLQEHLGDYIKTRMDNFSQERDVIIQHQRGLQQEMAKWPTQWVSEMLIEQQMEINKKMVEEITKLVESKNITSNLEVIRSAPVDAAITPPLPKSPKILFFMALGAFFGGLIPFAWMIVKTLTKGMPITAENLKIAEQHVSGSLSNGFQNEGEKPIKDQDLGTLRRLVTFLQNSSTNSQEPHRMLLLKGNHADYSYNLAQLLSKMGLKVLILPLSFDAPSPPKELPGLLQCLENKATVPVILREAGFDRIAHGGISRFSTELLGTQVFHNLLDNLQQRYDWIIAVTNAPVSSSDAESILQPFPFAAITITDETWPEIESCIRLQKHITFIIESDFIE